MEPRILARSISLKSAIRLSPYFLVIILCLFSRSALPVGLSESDFSQTKQPPATAELVEGPRSSLDVGKSDGRFDLLGKGSDPTNQQFAFVAHSSNNSEQSGASTDGVWRSVKESEIATNSQRASGP